MPFTDLFSRRFDLTNFELAGLLAHLTFAAFPSRRIETVAEIAKSFHRGLQLRVQLRHRTGFPFQTRSRNRKLVNQIGSKVEKINQKLVQKLDSLTEYCLIADV
jgi:hypothetical protein